MARSYRSTNIRNYVLKRVGVTLQKQDKTGIGKNGEDTAARHLLAKGYHVIERNWRYKRSEIDIIAEKEGVLVFVEVKTRSYVAYGHPEESVDEKKANKIMEGAEEYIFKVDWHGDIRFDVIAIHLEGNGHKLFHFEDAFG